MASFIPAESVCFCSSRTRENVVKTSRASRTILSVIAGNRCVLARGRHSRRLPLINPNFAGPPRPISFPDRRVRNADHRPRAYRAPLHRIPRPPPVAPSEILCFTIIFTEYLLNCYRVPPGRSVAVLVILQTVP